MSRSTTICIAWLMYNHKYNLAESYEMCESSAILVTVLLPSISHLSSRRASFQRACLGPYALCVLRG